MRRVAFEAERRSGLANPDALRLREGLSPQAKFQGYVIHNPETDDYLARVEEVGGMVRRSYAANPQHAKVFHKLDEALSQAFVIARPTVIGCLFDTEDRLVVAFAEPV